MNHLISIIVPVFNVEKYIIQAINSIQNQTYSNIEILLIDDGSTDGSGVICDQLAASDSRVKVIHKSNGGVSDARNSGLDNASGDLIGFVDPDDWIEPEMYSSMVRAIDETGSDIAICCVRKLYPDRDKLQDITRDKLFSRRKGMFELINNKDLESFSWNKLVRRELFDGIRYPLNRIFEDMDVCQQLFNKSRRSVFINKMFYNYRRRTDSALADWPLNVYAQYVRANQDRLEFVKKEWPDFVSISQEKYLGALHSLLMYMLDADAEEISMNAKFMSQELYPYFSAHSHDFADALSRAAIEKYNIMLRSPELFGKIWPSVRKIRTSIYNVSHK